MINYPFIISNIVLWRCFSYSVVFLYLMEEKTSLLILVPEGISTVIEVYIPVCMIIHNNLCNIIYMIISIQTFYCHLLAAKKKKQLTAHVIVISMTTPTNL